MKVLLTDLTVCLFLAMLSGAVMAQEADNSTGYHPFLTAKFHLGIGGFWPQKSLQIQVDGSDPAEEIDFEQDLGLDESESTTSLNFRCRYSKNW